MKYSTLNVNFEDSVAYVSLNRPAVRNAMNTIMVSELTKVFSELEQKNQVRIIVLFGEGQSFCAGVDLEDMKKFGKMDFQNNVHYGQELEKMYQTIDQCSKAIIGKVHGHVFGGGIGLCSVCDIVIAEKHTVFCLSEVLIGIIPAVIGPFTMKKTGSSHFRALGISAETFNGDYAEKIGLVHFTVTKEDVEKTTDSLLQQVKKASPQAIKYFKAYCRDMEKFNSAELIATLRASEEGQEGLSAFLEKRPPSWLK